MPGHQWEHHDERLPIDADLESDDPAEPSPAHRPVARGIRIGHPRALAAIGAGGFVGSMARYGLDLLWPAPSGHFPWATFAVNASGALLLGLVLTWILEAIGATAYLRAFSCVGVLGSWTTMSSFATGFDGLVRTGHAPAALAYLAGTVVCGIAATWIGITSARRFVDLRRAPKAGGAARPTW